MEDWRQKALTEVGGIKPFWVSKYGWNPVAEECANGIDLYVTFTKRRGSEGGSEEKPAGRFVLRLHYESDYETAGRRESFVNPENRAEEGPQFWPSGVQGINPGEQPRTICLEGTWGFHSHHHRDRDGRRAQLNKLLMEIQKCLNS
jgi:hypothetical protein